MNHCLCPPQKWRCLRSVRTLWKQVSHQARQRRSAAQSSLCSQQEGAYSLDLLIGDNALDVPLIWPLGAVAVSHQSADDSSTGLTAINALFRPKPEIVHLQRTPGRRPLSAVSVLFTALALAPLLLLYLMLSSVGANLKVRKSSCMKNFRLSTHKGCANKCQLIVECLQTSSRGFVWQMPCNASFAVLHAGPCLILLH